MPKKEAKNNSSQEQDKNKQKEIKVPKKFQSVVETIEKLTALELSELVKILEEKFGVSAQAPVVAMGSVPAGTGEGEAEQGEEEKASFNVELTNVGDSKIAVIKLVHEITGKGLKESKDLVEGAPVVVKENAPKEEAEELKKKFEEIGASIELK